METRRTTPEITARPTRRIATYGGFDWGRWLAVAGLALLVLVLVCGLAYSIGFSNGENAAVARLGR